MASRHDPDGTRLPIKIDSTSNGEFCPIPLTSDEIKTNQLALDQAAQQARRLNLPRRQFMVSLCGAATTLLALNNAYARRGLTGGFYALNADAAADPDAALESLGKREFIFDVQGHYVPPSVAASRKAQCVDEAMPVTREYMACLGADDFIKDVFLDSDTDMMVLSFVPSTPDDEPLTIEEAAATREIVAKMEDSRARLMLHGRVNPNQEGDLDRMDELAEKYDISAWKCYTQWGPDGKGFYLTDDVGIEFIEKARKLGVKNIAIHKGIPFGQRSYEHSRCTDIGPIAKRFPDVNFLIYHSGWIPGQAEGAYDPDRDEGFDGLINSVKNAGLGKHSNVYAELGSTWRGLMRDPDSAAHGLGKLITHLGEDNILWGTDSIWYGSPQDQILAFRSFQISEALQEQYGYQPITDSVRAKIFGLNATRPYNISPEEVLKRSGSDAIASAQADYLNNPDPHYLTRGPKTRRDFLRLLQMNGGNPA